MLAPVIRHFPASPQQPIRAASSAPKAVPGVVLRSVAPDCNRWVRQEAIPGCGWGRGNHYVVGGAAGF
jgi:hypothetical protein